MKYYDFPLQFLKIIFFLLINIKKLKMEKTVLDQLDKIHVNGFDSSNYYNNKIRKL